MNAIRVLEYAVIAWNNTGRFIFGNMRTRTKLRMVERETRKILNKG